MSRRRRSRYADCLSIGVKNAEKTVIDDSVQTWQDLRRIELAPAALVATAGGLFAMNFQYIAPGSVFDFRLSLSIVLMPIVGGVGTIAGPILGAVIFSWLQIKILSLPALRDSLKARLAALDAGTDRVSAAEARAKETRDTYLAAAGRLSAARRDAAAKRHPECEAARDLEERCEHEDGKGGGHPSNRALRKAGVPAGPVRSRTTGPPSGSTVMPNRRNRQQ